MSISSIDLYALSELLISQANNDVVKTRAIVLARSFAHMNIL